MRFAAIDIGSNAVRLLVEEVFLVGGQYHIEKVSFTRVPIRLGSDVFESGRIGDLKVEQLVKSMKASAMREAENGDDVVDRVKEETGISVELIDGDTEALLIFANFFVQNVDPKGNYIYIDVGGGSTECTLIKQGEPIKSKSFQLGTVRMLQGKVSKKRWVEARQWLEKVFEQEENLVAIGTGGNINKIFKEVGKKPSETISPTEIEGIYDFIKSYTYEQRITKLRLRPDRADVIIPAAEIYYNFMRFAGAEQMIVPKVGLSDGIILQLFNDWKDERD
jgi:exopolyphosphatase / guanosine-5'-triphosphate,3'-diphosphate pyrophosphatase